MIQRLTKVKLQRTQQLGDRMSKKKKRFKNKMKDFKYRQKILSMKNKRKKNKLILEDETCSLEY